MAGILRDALLKTEKTLDEFLRIKLVKRLVYVREKALEEFIRPLLIATRNERNGNGTES